MLRRSEVYTGDRSGGHTAAVLITWKPPPYSLHSEGKHSTERLGNLFRTTRLEGEGLHLGPEARPRLMFYSCHPTVLFPVQAAPPLPSGDSSGHGAPAGLVCETDTGACAPATYCPPLLFHSRNTWRLASLTLQKQPPKAK